ncbi:Uncharacterized protein HZ326_18899 [Fusarium oxysporum f. sp. albedinis]|nr:Uncharacterized protein HZ326_18899 [Fusarium oxysporum f. sp. albedinis]
MIGRHVFVLSSIPGMGIVNTYSLLARGTHGTHVIRICGRSPNDPTPAFVFCMALPLILPGLYRRLRST